MAHSKCSVYIGCCYYLLIIIILNIAVTTNKATADTVLILCHME